jgi:hypothetical protein
MLGHGSEVTQVTQFHLGHAVYRQKLLEPEKHTISQRRRRVR